MKVSNHSQPIRNLKDSQTLLNPVHEVRSEDMATAKAQRWGVVLAGGDGLRLRRLTQLVAHDNRPKQFCKLLGKNSLLHLTRKRAEKSIMPNHIFYSLTQAHENFFLHDLSDIPRQRVVQPFNKGTAPAILYTLLHISSIDPDAVVSILPCDHHFSKEKGFTAALESAFAVASSNQESITLIGAQPKSPEVEFGWIDLGDRVKRNPEVYRVNGFREKPDQATAEALYARGSLWNTFIMVGHLSAFLNLAQSTVPDLLSTLKSSPLFPSIPDDIKKLKDTYESINSVDFSQALLAPGIESLMTIALGSAGWNDLGDPRRVLMALEESKIVRPKWARHWLSTQEIERNSIN